MEHFYDGQIRRYLLQTIRVLSNFTVKYGDGSLVRVPVAYGDAERQAASIIRNNSENSVNSVPRISVYISGLDMDKERLSDATYVGKMHLRERDIVDGTYTQGQGRNYTVERLMPTPFKLTMKCDIWSANTEQKLQILEQILVLFNPSLELQTTDNYIDWTSLSVLNLTSTNWSSKTMPVGTELPIDVATLTFDSPIWLSPPVKVKHLGVITRVVTSFYESSSSDSGTYIEGLGQPLATPGLSLSGMLAEDAVTISGYNILVYNNEVTLLGPTENEVPREPTLEIGIRQGASLSWQELFDKYPGRYVPGSSTIFLLQANGTDVVGTVAINPLDPTILTVSWDKDTISTNTGIDSQGLFDYEPGYDREGSNRPNSTGTFDRIVDPTKQGPGNSGLGTPTVGLRYLLVDDIGSAINADGADAWKGTDNSDLIANANDIIEWDGTRWVVIFNSAQKSEVLIYQTNIYTGVQYTWNGVQWAKSFEGDYQAGKWRLVL